jgi:ribbon-helix-helix CopG family protein
MKTLSIKLPDFLAVRLSSAARRAGVGKSEVVRKAIESYLDKSQVLAGDSCLELARDLAGCLEGPGDLSHNRRKMRGYGR